jgi:hypothetical protein
MTMVRKPVAQKVIEVSDVFLGASENQPPRVDVLR